MIISASTESIVSNVVAYEQCHCVDIYLNDYVSLMENIVSTPKDAELIVQKGIIGNDIDD
ncbi:hypothetical protein Dsin_019210 [Dipteronia sinensis]|uniref:Uncharacterized protein n=1 Tax=Dipteronia sinensis TaxID=43782 RepID=A0AAE0A7K4_9ROSI|nr:hypothetical protein Dsin_019210 [Dipteronia sinensis]